MLKRLLILAVIFLLPACAQTELATHVAKQTPIADSSKPKGYFKVGSSYRIKGQRYTPRETYNFTQTGMASWYGPNFHGKMTANGEIFDKYELTAAHKTLQMPSIVRVTNLENGRSIIVRVNDRGPFSKGRIIDLSERAAEMLDFKHKGVAKVKIQVLPEESRKVASLAKSGKATRGLEVALNEKGVTPKPTEQRQQKPIMTASAAQPMPNTNAPPRPLTKPNKIYVQAGSFNNVVKARALAEQLRSVGTARIQTATINGSQYYRVQFGPVQNQAAADQIATKLASANIGEPILIRE